jgi:hypothetical protein
MQPVPTLEHGTDARSLAGLIDAVIGSAADFPNGAVGKRSDERSA